MAPAESTPYANAHVYPGAHSRVPRGLSSIFRFGDASRSCQVLAVVEIDDFQTDRRTQDSGPQVWASRARSLEVASDSSSGGFSNAFGGSMTGPPAARPPSKFPGLAGQIGEVYEVRWPDGRRFDNRRTVSEYQARLLVEGGVCEEKRSPTGILRYLRMRRNAPMKKFASILAAANFTTTQTCNLHEHVASKKKGL
jgi:hypothetical protein